MVPYRCLYHISHFHLGHQNFSLAQGDPALQVFVQQMWHFVLSCSRMASRHPVFTGESDNIGTLLLMLRQRGIDWTNLELWPKEMVDGQLGQLSPLLTLLDGAPEVIIPVCTGKITPIPAACLSLP